RGRCAFHHWPARCRLWPVVAVLQHQHFVGWLMDKTIEQQARELLAEEYEQHGAKASAHCLRDGEPLTDAWEKAAINAITRALESAGQGEACWRDLAEANGAIVDEIREIVGLKGKPGDVVEAVRELDRKSTRLNSSHVKI